METAAISRLYLADIGIIRVPRLAGIENGVVWPAVMTMTVYGETVQVSCIYL